MVCADLAPVAAADPVTCLGQICVQFRLSLVHMTIWSFFGRIQVAAANQVSGTIRRNKQVRKAASCLVLAHCPLTSWAVSRAFAASGMPDDRAHALHCAAKLLSGNVRQADVVMILARPLAVTAALAICVAAAPAPGRPAPHTPAVTCTNPVSGATWTINIDFDRSRVDANPARITTTQVSWHDERDGGNYTLDRKSGALTIILPSSTGGYFMHDRCRLPP